MAARAADVVKALMKLGVMATVTQTLDADTAELVVQEFGHRARRVSESDVEQGIEGTVDIDTDLVTRAPVVTVMGHVDHGKTSLLDALRATDVAAGEAGGITQHIGAYQVTLKSGNRITFIDTPGHEAFTSMRSRGAAVTDIVVLVVAADDGVMPQTIEAIRHAKAANAPLIIAINKMDKADANPARVRQELLQYEIVVEEMGGETQDVEVSATKKINLDKLEEAILLQAELLDLKANPDRLAEGSVIESRLDKGRGPVATMLVQKGTLHAGEIVVAGAEWGRVRALLDDKGRSIKEAGPSTPVEILGLGGVPSAGEPFVVVEDEGRAREISEFRQRKVRDKTAAGATAARGTLEEMLTRIAAGAQKEVAILIKADVQGSAEAIQATVQKTRARRSQGSCSAGRRRADHRNPISSSRKPATRSSLRSTCAPPARPARSPLATASISATTRSSTRSPTTSNNWSKARSRRNIARASWATRKSARSSTSPRPARSPAAWSPKASSSAAPACACCATTW